MPRRDHRIQPRERIEAVEAELRIAGKALDRRSHEPILQVLTEQQFVFSDSFGHREPRFELVDEGEPLAKPGLALVWLDAPLVRSAVSPDLGHARRESAVLGDKRVRPYP